MEQPKPPSANNAPYIAIVGITTLLCFGWLLTGSLVLTLIIIALGLLHLAQYFPDAEEIVGADPILLWLRRFSLLIVLVIAGLVLLARAM